ncbi:MAG: hypothetical protein JW990_01600, partial [Thermoleophilia bacterium]|nr:hypothetical protein [Thermoleophilia bacterium]
GVTITGGAATAGPEGVAAGGGILCSGESSPTISNVILSDNRADGGEWSQATEAKGGGLYCAFGSPRLEDIVFHANQALAYSDPESGRNAYGGGMYCESGAPLLSGIEFRENLATGRYARGGGLHCSDADPALTDVLFENNLAQGELYGSGGALDCTDSSPAITDVFFSGNTAWGSHVGSSGGAMNMRDASFTLIDASFIENVAGGGLEGGRGGALAFSGPTNPVVLQRITFDGNETQGAHFTSGGGAVHFSGATELVDCIFINNATASGGGAVLVSAQLEEDVTLTGCLFLANQGNTGGAIQVLSGYPRFNGCTFHENVADFRGGAVHHVGGVGSMESCSIVGNHSPEGCGVFVEGIHVSFESTVLAFGEGGAAVEGCHSPYLSFTCCDIYGNAGGDWIGEIAHHHGVNGNIAEDPLFCDLPGDDFTLYATSPCAPFTPPNEDCDLIGAWPVGCGPTTAKAVTWGAIKAMFSD